MPGLKTLRVENVDFQNERSGFLNVQSGSPLGAIGMSLTSLKFGKVTIVREPYATELLNSQSIATSLRWLFSTRIASLPKLKELCLPPTERLGATGDLRPGGRSTPLHDRGLQGH